MRTASRRPDPLLQQSDHGFQRRLTSQQPNRCNSLIRGKIINLG
jgi:hypothetical protein